VVVLLVRRDAVAEGLAGFSGGCGGSNGPGRGGNQAYEGFGNQWGGNIMFDLRIGEIIAGCVLGASIIGTVAVCRDRDREHEAMMELIRAEVRAEVKRQYRNVPHIEVEKVYTLHATGEDIVIETVEEKGKR